MSVISTKRNGESAANIIAEKEDESNSPKTGIDLRRI